MNISASMDFRINSKTCYTKIKEKWNILRKIPGVFAYNLKVSEKKFLQGNYNFYSELNPERTSLRRAPQKIPSLIPAFDTTKFNFTKVNKQERLLDIGFGDTMVSMLINRSPLTDYHTLICPDLNGCHSQIITREALHFCIAFLLSLDDDSVRIGYNSPGALASVNHLHLHLIHINCDLYIDDAELELLAYNRIYRLSNNMPTDAICFVFNKDDDLAIKTSLLKELYTFLQWLCTENMPHNIFMTPYRGRGDSSSCIKVFVFAREKHCEIKDVTAFNVGFCELAGYIPVGSIDLFTSLTEDKVISKIRTETSATYSKIYEYFLKKAN